MTSGAKVEVDLGPLLVTCRRLVAGLDADAVRESKQVADSIASQARDALPHRSGRLAASVDSEPLRGQPTEQGAQVSYGAGVPYAGWIEYGGSRGRPRTSEGRYVGPIVDRGSATFPTRMRTAAASTTRKFR